MHMQCAILSALLVGSNALTLEEKALVEMEESMSVWNPTQKPKESSYVYEKPPELVGGFPIDEQMPEAVPTGFRRSLPLNPLGEGERTKEVIVFKNAEVDCKGRVWKDGAFMTSEYYEGCGQGGGGCWAYTSTSLDQKSHFHPNNHPKEFDGEYAQSPQGAYDKGVINKDRLDTIVVLTQAAWGAYYHFVIDALSRYVWAKEQFPDLVNRKTTFFHTGYANQVGQSWAKLVGIESQDGPVDPKGKGNRLLEGWWSGRKVLYPPSNQCANRERGAQPHAIKGMHELIQMKISDSEAAKEKTKGDRKKIAVLIDRKQGPRSIANQDEVLKAVQAELHDWEVKTHEPTMSVTETCELFQTADMVIGPHGAGFVNVMCAKKGTPTVEMQQKPHAHDFEILSAKIGNPYYGVLTDLLHFASFTTLAPDKIKALRAGVKKAREDLEKSLVPDLTK